MNTKILLHDFTGGGHFGSLTSLANAGDLRCGAYCLRNKILLKLKLHGIESIVFDMPSPLDEKSGTPKLPVDSPCNIVLSSRGIYENNAIERIKSSTGSEKFVTPTGELLGFHLSHPVDLAKLVGNSQEFESLPAVSIAAKRIDFPWHLDNYNGAEISADLLLATSISKGDRPQLATDIIVRGQENVWTTGSVNIGSGVIISAENNTIRLENGSTIGAGAILSADDGPIWLGENSIIEPGAILQGPVYVGPYSIVRAGARLNGNVSLGIHCRVGGELSSVIMQGYSNKQHSGYLGGAVIGQWANLGAATDNSDLKNNYRPIDVTLNGVRIDSGELHVGVYLGDFVRTAIQTRLNSGTVIGTCCNLFGNDFPEKSMPPFIWYGANRYQEYRLDKAIETIKIVMERRRRSLSSALEEALNKLYDSSSTERNQFLKSQFSASK